MNTLRRLLLFALVVSLPGCGGDDPSGPADPESPLASVVLNVGAATSLDVVRVEGLPLARRVDGYSARVSTSAGEAGTLPLEQDELGPFFRAPLHPQTPLDGGAVTVQITDGEHASPDLDLDVGALPEAPGAFAALVTALRSHVDQRARWAGSSLEDLAATSFEATPAALLPLKVAQSFVDAGAPGDLTSLVANEDGVLSSDERELLDRIFGHADLRSLVQADVDWFGQNDPTYPDPGESTAIARRSCIDHKPPIATAPQLAEAMLARAMANVAIDPNGAPGQTLRQVGGVIIAGSLLPGFGTAFSVAGVGLAGWTASRNMTASLQPSSFVSLSYDVTHPVFDEDDTDEGSWANVEVRAASTGWTVDRDIANLVINTFGAVLSGAQVTQLAASEALLYAEIAALNEGLAQHLEESDGLIEYCPQTWDVDISNLPFSTATSLDNRFDVDPATRRFVPKEVGADVLRVVAQPSTFGGVTIEADAAIECKAIVVDVIPDEVEILEPGEAVVLTVALQNAEGTELHWDAAHGEWADGVGAETTERDTRSLNTPTNPEHYPFPVIVRSESRSGLRASGVPLRHDQAWIRLRQARIQVLPPFECISPGDSFQFTADVTGIEDYTVLWEVIEGYGSINADGLYQSLAGGVSNAVIQASIEGIENAVDTARIEASSCSCRFDFQFTGTGGSGVVAGAQIAYRVSNFGDLFYQFFVETENENVLIGMSLAPSDEQSPPEPGEFGDYDVSFVYAIGDQSWNATPDDDDAGVVLSIGELTETHMTASIFGTIVRRDQEGNVLSSLLLSGDLRAGNWDGRWPCE